MPRARQALGDDGADAFAAGDEDGLVSEGHVVGSPCPSRRIVR